MLPNIKACQSETESALSSSILSFMLYTGHLRTKRSFLILISSCHVCLHSHKMILLYWLDGLEGTLNQLLEQKNLGSVLKSIST